MNIDAKNRRDPAESDDERMTDAATALLQRRLEGDPHRSAVRFVCASHALSPGEVHRSWLAKRRDALAALDHGPGDRRLPLDRRRGQAAVPDLRGQALARGAGRPGRGAGSP